MLIDYLPRFLAEIEEFKQIMNSCQEDIDNIEIEINRVISNLFIQAAGLTGIERYEKILKISPKLSDSLDIRKANILLLYNSIPPFTYERLLEMLNSICGESNYTIKLDYINFLLIVKIKLAKKELKSTVNELLERIVPLNIILNLELDYNIWNDIKAKRWSQLLQFIWTDTMEEEYFKIE